MVERQLATKFVAEWTPPAILVLAPPVVLKENLKSERIDKRTDISEWEKDSILFEQSKFLKNISDSVFLETYLNAMIRELREQSYLVYIEADLDSFLVYPGEAYILDIGQILLEEYLIPYTEQETFDDTIAYYKRIDLDALSINSWFDLSKMNTDKEEPKLLFASHYLHDYLKGRFTRHPLKGTVEYKYQLKPMKLEDIYRLSAILGQKYASWLTDYFINTYIRTELPEGREPEARFSFDRRTGNIKRVFNDRFQEL